MLPNGELPVSLYEPMTMLGHFALPTKEDVPVEVIRAKHAGVCYGVERALDMANAAMLDDEATYTLGPLIHNPKVVEARRQRRSCCRIARRRAGRHRDYSQPWRGA